MMQRKFHYLLLNAESKELEQKNQNNNQEENMNIKKREEKRREEKIFTYQGEGRANRRIH